MSLSSGCRCCVQRHILWRLWNTGPRRGTSRRVRDSPRIDTACSSCGDSTPTTHRANGICTMGTSTATPTSACCTASTRRSTTRASGRGSSGSPARSTSPSPRATMTASRSGRRRWTTTTSSPHRSSAISSANSPRRARRRAWSSRSTIRSSTGTAPTTRRAGLGCAAKNGARSRSRTTPRTSAT